ncbi:hypothetical protein PMAYCL1PPCAC_25613, partial [Pristionchus mayeri]
ITAFEKRDNMSDIADFSLECGVDHNGPWKCDAEERVTFDADKSFVKLSKHIYWQYLDNSSFNVNDKFIVSFEIHITSADRLE